jgi:hypothetical protein
LVYHLAALKEIYRNSNLFKANKFYPVFSDLLFIHQDYMRSSSYPSNGMYRSCEATMYPVLDKLHTTGILGAQGPQATEKKSARFSGSLYYLPR